MRLTLKAKNGWVNLYDGGFYRGTVKPGKYKAGFRVALPGNKVVEGFKTQQAAADYAFSDWK